MQINNIDTIDTVYGRMLVHVFDNTQVPTLRHTGRALAHKELLIFAEYVKAGSTFIDVGANMGTFSLAYAKMAGKVYAFEPQRNFAYMLAGSIALNNLESKIVLNDCAVGRADGWIQCPILEATVPTNFGGVEMGIDQKEPIGQSASGYYSVHVVSLDDYFDQSVANGDLADHPPISAIKIDVEGMELEVLAGAIKLINRYKPAMLVEHCKSPKDILRAELSKFGFYTIHDIGADFLCIPE